MSENKTSGAIILFKVAVTAVACGAFIGGTTNMINGAISPFYFAHKMGWDFGGIWSASVAQGIFEGVLYGIIFSIIFTTAFGIITKGEGSFSFAFHQLLKVVLIAYTCWFIGGLLVCLLALLSPDFFYSHYLRDARLDTFNLLRYAWVGGSISGGIFGGLIGIFLGIVNLKNAWRNLDKVAD